MKMGESMGTENNNTRQLTCTLDLT